MKDEEPIKLKQDPLKVNRSKLYFLVPDERNLFYLKTSSLYLLSELDRERGVDRVFFKRGEDYLSMSLKYCENHEIPTEEVESDDDFVKKIPAHKLGKILAYITTKKRKDIEEIIKQISENSFSINIREKNR